MPRTVPAAIDTAITRLYGPGGGSEGRRGQGAECDEGRGAGCRAGAAGQRRVDGTAEGLARAAQA
ncbi:MULTISPECIES: hypothetical protein [Streptomyces]|uniref:hypothetical protein n=1 Tax=Streptomyces TaxID=1883 RepID=UPI0018768BD9|nr:hypothetical protein GCM10010504_18230 [Streptomyces griseus]